jgi:MFS family permease
MKKIIPKGVLICFLGALFYCYEYLLRIIPGVMQAELRMACGNISATAFGTLTAYYYFAYTPMQLPAGMLMDRYGPHKLLSLACLLCALGSMLFAETDMYYMVILGRFLVGLGSSFAFVGVLKLANNWLPRGYISLVAGIVTTLGMCGAILGEVGLSQLILVKGWQAVLDLAIFAGIILTILIIFFIRDTPNPVEKSKNKTMRFFFKEVYLVVKQFQIWVIGLIGALLYLSLSVFAEIWGKSYLIMAHSLTPMEAANIVSMVFLGWAIGAPIMGLLSDWTEKRIAFLFTGALLGALTIAIILYAQSLSFVTLSVLLFLYGFFCSVEIVVFVLARESSDSKLVGTVFAVVNMIVMIGGAIFQPLVGKLLDVFWDGHMVHAIRMYSKLDYQLVLSFLPLSLVLVAILTFFVKTSNPN